MCTAASYKTKDFYFGRTLDYEFSYGDEIVVLPREYPLRFRHCGALDRHYAIIGMAYVAGSDPLFYDGINEKGLGMAGLNFVGNAHYFKPVQGFDNVAQFEFIPWILSRCATVREARGLLSRINLTDEAYSPQLPPAQLHWIIADRDEAITVESMSGGLKIYDNPVGVLTNNPPFDRQMLALSNYMSRRSVLAVALCSSCVYEDEFKVRRLRGGERQPVFPHSRLRRSAARLLRGRGRQV